MFNLASFKNRAPVLYQAVCQFLRFAFMVHMPSCIADIFIACFNLAPQQQQLKTRQTEEISAQKKRKKTTGFCLGRNIYLALEISADGFAHCVTFTEITHDCLPAPTTRLHGTYNVLRRVCTYLVCLYEDYGEMA